MVPIRINTAEGNRRRPLPNAEATEHNTCISPVTCLGRPWRFRAYPAWLVLIPLGPASGSWARTQPSLGAILGHHQRQWVLAAPADFGTAPAAVPNGLMLAPVLRAGEFPAWCDSLTP